jgi:hypothetical protein
MKTYTYISGRHRVGKLTVATAVRGSLPGVSLISGREYWERYADDMPFEERLSKTNQDVQKAAQDSDSSDILCEWVPCRSGFVDKMYDPCASVGRPFLHVHLMAYGSVLQARRKEVGVEEELGDDPGPRPDPQEKYDCMVFDTGVEQAANIADAIVKWILSNQ